MRKSILIATIMVFALVGIYSCKSVETTSAMLHNQHGQYELAIKLAKLALKKNPNDAEAHFQLGVSYSFTDSVGKAYEEFMIAKRLDPKKTKLVEDNIKHNWVVKFNEGITESQSENLEGAAKAFEQATQADPRNVKGWLNLSKVYYLLSDTDSTYLEKSYVAVDTLMAKISRDDPEYSDALALAGKIMVRKGERDKALEIFDKLLTEDPANFSAVEDVGTEFLVKEDYENAAPFLKMAIEARRRAQTESFDAYYNLGLCYYNMQKYIKSVEAYREAVQLEPNNRDAHYGLLRALLEADLIDEAIMQGKKYTTEIAPDDYRGWWILSQAYKKKGLKKSAEEAAKKFLELQQGAGQ